MRKLLAAALAAVALVALTGTASAQTSFPWPPTDITPVYKTKAELEQQAERFSAHQQRTYRWIFPGAQEITPSLWGHEAGNLFDGLQYMNNRVKFTYGDRKVMIITQVHAPGRYDASPEQLCEHVRCTGTVGDHRGGLIVLHELDQFGIRTATNFRPNGEVVWAQGGVQDNPFQLAAVAADRHYTFTG
ncbi:hypothetical protein [Saccharothrix obliqua]|uniref:hypothetical protein n=1 Tax=Saccharothrix obliqua TaxID=2861747 RepID=UPI001C5D6626|nr:hypothetical protein [Saccharothrix obliqua]MBW4721392.1 hypothetical protein [Saccharothrix obliqua]